MGSYVNIGEAKTRLSELVAASLRGEEVILARAGVPVARIVGLASAVEDVAAAERAARAARWAAWIGSKAGMMPTGAGDAFLEPSYSDAAVAAMARDPDDPAN